MNYTLSNRLNNQPAQTAQHGGCLAFGDGPGAIVPSMELRY